MEGVTLLAPAKLTLSLRITGVRADGYHLLDAEMVSIDLCDELTFGPGDGLTVEDATGGSLLIPDGDDNLVRRALAAVGRRAAVRLVKRIPAGAGLGGGSADAAAVLRWAGRASDLDLAVGLGADVPFCAQGGRARVTGVGEELVGVPCEPGAAYTLLTPPLAVSTAAAYRAWDEVGGPAAAGVNDLEPAALVVEPRLASWRDKLGEATGQQPTLAGSGSTWWVPGSFPDAVPGVMVVRTVCP
jgi:4-diphosphocytidyl-2-C-methyl-D-erythritol kinase